MTWSKFSICTFLHKNYFHAIKPDIEKWVLAVPPHLYGLRLINICTIQTPMKGVNEWTAGEILGEK